MDIPYILLDFEYNGTQNARYNLVSVAVATAKGRVSFWLHDKPEVREYFKQWLIKKRNTHFLLAFNVDAEARALVSLGLNPITFKWIDIQAEWKMLTNHNDKWSYGKQFIDGKIKTTHRLDYGEDKNPKLNYSKPPVNLLGSTYKLLGLGSTEDYETKNLTRDLIIKNTSWSEESRKQILDYGASDVDNLYTMYQVMFKEFKRLYKNKKSDNDILKDMLWRGETVARAAVIASIGYPVDRESVVNFTNNIPQILIECQEDINSQFEEELFRWNKKDGRYSLNTKVIKAHIKESSYYGKWPRTPKGDVQIGLDAFEKFFSWRHTYPSGNLFAQFFRYLRLSQSLNGFKPKSVTAKNKSTFFSSYGSDDRAHPYLNAYGAQSSRYQPKATGFLHLKAAWMRSLVQPKKGKVICGIDYGSEEFLIAGLMAKDMNMIKAYESGDVYLYFAKIAGAVPWDGEKKDYKNIRDKFKSTTLGLSYGMGATALAAKLTVDTGEQHEYGDALELSDQFWDAFPDYAEWIEDLKYDYSDEDMVILPDGWTMWGDNDNARSVGNMPIQGMGAVILRKAIQLAQDAGLVVILPLHDALYMECNIGDWSKIDLMARCMRDAFAFYFKDKMKEYAHKLIRLDTDVWGPDLSDGFDTTPGGVDFKTQTIYIDPRSKEEYEKFSKYFKAK